MGERGWIHPDDGRFATIKNTTPEEVLAVFVAPKLENTAPAEVVVAPEPGNTVTAKVFVAPRQ